jgi:hypothetical protein
MKALCSACDRLFELKAVRREGAQVVIACASCGSETTVPVVEAAAVSMVAEVGAPAPSPAVAVEAPQPLRVVPSANTPSPPLPKDWPPSPTAMPEGVCPKCFAKRTVGEMTCRSCGLVYDNFAPDETALSAELAAAWSALATRWNERPAHDAFLQLAQARQELQSAGRLYRLASAIRPHDLQAKMGKDAVLKMAMTATELLRAPSPVESSPGGLTARQWIAVVAAVLVPVILLLFLRSILAAE